MFPGFVSLYKNNEGKICLYYFPGLTNDMKPIYMALDMSNIEMGYTFVKNPDNSVIYTFADDNITTVTARMINKKTGVATISKIKL